jgi:hypothetical protein
MDILREFSDQRAHMIKALFMFILVLAQAWAPSLSFYLSSIPFTTKQKANAINPSFIEIHRSKKKTLGVVEIPLPLGPKIVNTHFSIISGDLEYKILLGSPSWSLSHPSLDMGLHWDV